MSTALAELVVKLTGDVSEFERSMQGASGSVETMGSKIGAAGAALGTAVVAGAAVAGAALVGLGVASVGVASDFESQMAIMSTAVDPVSLGVESAAEAMNILSEASLAVGADTQLIGVSASGASEAITGLYKAGMTTSEIFGDLNGYLAGTADLGGALRASVDLAAASELDMVAASELAAVTLATFGGELTTAAERSDFVNSAMNNFVQTADASVASVQDLADAFVNVGPTAAAMGMGVEQVNTALGIMSMRGITGAEAGTQLKSMLLGMQNDASNAGGALAELGVSLYDMDGAMRPLPDVIGDLESAMSGMTEQQRNQYVATIAGTYGMNALNSLLAEGSTGWNDMEEAIGSAATMQETAAARSQTFQGAMESLGGVVETLQIRIGTALIPILTMLADMGAVLIERFGPVLEGAFQAVADIMTAVGTAAQQFFTALEAGESPMDALINALMRLGQELGIPMATLAEIRVKLDEFLTAVGAVVGPIAQAVTQFVSWKDVLIVLGGILAGVVLSAILSVVAAMLPIVVVAAALVAAVALLRNAWENNWGGIQEKTAAVVEFIRGIITGLQTWWNAVFPQLRETVMNAWTTIQSVTQTVWGVIQTAIQTAVGIIGPTVQTMMTTIQGAFAGGEPFINRFKELWASLTPLFQAIVPIVGAVVTVLVGLFNGILSAVGPLVSGIMGAVQSIIGIFTGLITFVTGFLNLLVGLFTGDGERIKAAVQQMGDGVKAIWENLVSGVISLVTGLWDAVKALVTGLVDGVVQFFTTMYQTLVGGSIVPDMVNAIIGWIENLSATLLAITEGIRAFFEAIWSAIQAFMEMVWSLIVAIVTGNIESARAVIETVWSAVQGFWESVWSAIQSFTESVWSALKSFIDSTINAIRSVVETVWNAVKSFWESTWNAIKSTTETIWNAIKSFIQSTIESVRGIIQGFITTIQGAWNTFLGSLYNAWRTAWDRIRNVMDSARNFLSGIAAAIVTAIFNAFNKDWGSIGRDIVSGIGNALSAGLAWVAQKAREIAEAALAAAMAALGIGSPSREFAYLGEMSVAGYTQPFKDTRTIERAVVRAMDAGVAAGGRMTSQTIDRGTRIGTVNVQGGNGLSLLRQMEAAGVRK